MVVKHDDDAAILHPRVAAMFRLVRLEIFGYICAQQSGRRIGR